MPLLRFEALFKNKEIHQEFHKFLAEDKSEESWDFLKTSMKYKKKYKSNSITTEQIIR